MSKKALRDVVIPEMNTNAITARMAYHDANIKAHPLPSSESSYTAHKRRQWHKRALTGTGLSLLGVLAGGVVTSFIDPDLLNPANLAWILAPGSTGVASALATIAEPRYDHLPRDQWSNEQRVFEAKREALRKENARAVSAAHKELDPVLKQMNEKIPMANYSITTAGIQVSTGSTALEKQSA